MFDNLIINQKASNMNLFGMEKHHTKSMWLLAILIAFSTTVCAQGTSVTGRVSDEKESCS